VSRRPTRWLLLGAGPLKRTTDRLHALSRLVLLLSLLAALPLGVAADRAVSTALHRTADAQATGHARRTATLLADAPVATSPDDDLVFAPAAWTGSPGRIVTGRVLAPSGASLDSTVTVWVDSRGAITTPPLGSSDVTAESVLSGVLAALGLPLIVCLVHLLVVHLLDRARLRRWTAEWAAIEPLWEGRTG
jgi:hypothetical protein